MTRWWLLRALVSVLIVAVLITVVPLDRLGRAIRDVRPWVWGAAVLIFIAGHAINALKFRILIGADDDVSVRASLRAQFAGLAANLGLPGVTGGDIVRAGYLLPSTRRGAVMSAAIADRIIDTVVLAAMAALALAFVGVPPALAKPVREAGWWLVLAGVVVVGISVMVWRFVRRRAATKSDGQDSPASLPRAGAVALAFVGGALVQTTFVLTNVWLASEVGLPTAVAPWFLAWPGAKLSTLLPISLNGLGVREAALVSLMAAYGAAGEAVLAAGLLWQGAIVVGSLAGFLATQAWGR